MHKEYIPESMANKYYFGEADSSAHQRIVDVVVYKAEDDEEIGVIELYYDYDKKMLHREDARDKQLVE